MSARNVAMVLLGMAPMPAFAVDGSLTHWVASAAQNGVLDQAFWYSVFASCGIGAHYVKQYLSQKTDSTFWQYLVKEYPGRTVFMISGQVAAAAATGLTGAWDGMGWGSLIATAFTTGYTIDSLMNRAEPAVTA